MEVGSNTEEKVDRKQWPIDKQAKYQVDVLLRYGFKREELEEAHKQKSTVPVDYRLRKVLTKRAAIEARNDPDLLAWSGSSTLERGAAGSLRAFITGHSQSFSYETWVCIERAIASLEAHRDPGMEDEIARGHANTYTRQVAGPRFYIVYLPEVADALDATDIPKSVQFTFLAWLSEKIEV